ncbi:antibiotic biosynthesis monooxygenase [Pseudosulfitobacter pseudonitzschiae]|uniref:Antibiotic biosynthesis monooxygenase n=1 Tax=Pseudosulfitobacter pseudonitzschiae TaxID=1402135 RepID=A0A073IZ92_9RHOB|nr:antibiotic biosynthesis monooxygenase [Pseudosulfitobacter pseudonitzschiae]KEJ94930.1 antibiotic biosynthesis monooxygenase [Pseudosulfitobacter pseudonitzschiae]QKS07404.1 antibiotic biosynthesis monooxygenase [Pseudosulfitobacter pseudonitzschiae]
MIAVIFEVEPAEGKRAAYLDIAAAMRPLVDEVEGFLGVERFESLTTPGKLLSLSFFEDEAAVERWRTLTAHRGAQSKGRGGVFADYRLRVAHVIRDYGMFDRTDAPEDSRAAHGGSGQGT